MTPALPLLSQHVPGLDKLATDAIDVLVSGRNAGHFALPAEIEAGLRAVDRATALFVQLQAERQSLVSTANAREGVAVTAAVAAILGGGNPPATLGVDLIAAMGRVAQLDALLPIYLRIGSLVASRLGADLISATPAIVDLLADALADMLREAEPHVETLGHTRIEVIAELLKAPPSVGAAYRRLEVLAARHDGIRLAAHRVWRSQPSHTVTGHWIVRFAGGGVSVRQRGNGEFVDAHHEPTGLPVRRLMDAVASLATAQGAA